MSSPKFTKTDKSYTFLSAKVFGKNFTVPITTLESILRWYCCDRYLTALEISRKLNGNLSKKKIEFIIRALGISHKSIPFLDEKVANFDPAKLTDEMLQIKKSEVSELFEKKSLARDQEDALKWRLLEQNVLTPIEKVCANWKPSTKKVTVSKRTSTGTEELIVGCSDWHYGLYANARYLWNQKEWNIERTVATVDAYADRLVETISRNNYRRINIAFLGDLLHGLSGFTDKGTRLEAHPLKEEQFVTAMNSVLSFLNKIVDSHDNIRVFGCSGNHDSMGDYLLILMMKTYFRNDPRIKFEITNKRNLTFDIGGNLFLMEHGYSSVSRDRLPPPGASRENYINNLFLSHPERMSKAKRFYYLSADQHHTENYELTNVEGFMFPTLIGGDRHSDNSGYKGRQRQTCLVVHPSRGVEEVKYFNLD